MRQLFVGLLVSVVLLACTGPASPPREAAALASTPRADSLLILVSFDGWRWDYDTKAPTPNLRALMARGVRAEGLIPAFPSKTVPNHYSIATGMYPGRHGMIANVIRDPSTGRLFERTNRKEVGDPMWWGGDPIWNVAQRSGRTAATMFWVGSEAAIGGMQPRFWREYDETFPADDRVRQVLAWLDQPPPERPSFLTLYFEQVDRMGHWYGPDSPQVRDAIIRTDTQLGTLVSGLRERGLFETTNIVVVSDHGMTSTTRDRTIIAEEVVAIEDVEIADINPTLGVMPRAGREDAVFRRLVNAHPHLRMYRREDTPAHWRFREQARVPRFTGVADEGWVVLRRANLEEYWKRGPNGGQHGYDPRLASMRGIFVAAGPAFRSGMTVPAFENVSVFNVLAATMGLAAPPNDGDPAVVRRVLRGL